MITSTISYVEFVTFLISITLLGLVSYSYYLSVGDNTRLRKRPTFVKNGSLHRLSKGRIRTEVRKVLTGLVWVSTLTVFMFEGGGGNYLKRTTLTLVSAILFTLLAMAVDTVLYLFDRSKIEEDLEKVSKQLEGDNNGPRREQPRVRRVLGTRHTDLPDSNYTRNV
jgi:hypothetical protein